MFSQVGVRHCRRSKATLEKSDKPLSPTDGSSVVCMCCDEMVRLWRAATCVPLETLDPHPGSVNSGAFSLDGKVVDTLLLSSDWAEERGVCNVCIWVFLSSVIL